MFEIHFTNSFILFFIVIGRAGMDGIATTFLTEGDSDVFYELKHYLEVTSSVIPNELSKHPSANAKPGDVVQKRRDTVMFAR